MYYFKKSDEFSSMFRPRLSSINLEVKDMGMLGGADLNSQPCVVSKGFELTPIECLQFIHYMMQIMCVKVFCIDFHLLGKEKKKFMEG